LTGGSDGPAIEGWGADGDDHRLADRAHGGAGRRGRSLAPGAAAFPRRRGNQRRERQRAHRSDAVKERAMTCGFSDKPAARRYRRDIAVAGVLYVSLVFAGALAIRNFELPQWLVIVLALAPVVPALMMLRAYLVFL